MPGAGDGEQRHRLGEAVDRRAPRLPEQQQDRRDQRAGVADADPPDEVDDVEGPADRDVVAPDADALRRPGRSSETSSSTGEHERDQRSRANQPSGVLRVRTIALILSVTEPNVWPGAITGGVPVAAHRSSCGSFGRQSSHRSSAQLRIRVAHRGQIRRARPRVQLGEQRSSSALRPAAARRGCSDRSGRRRRSRRPGRPAGRRSRSRRRGSGGLPSPTRSSRR